MALVSEMSEGKTIMERTRIGIIGCGMISDTYLAAARRFPMLEVVGCADLNTALAEEKGRKHGVKAVTVEALLSDSSIELVVNLTPPKAHSAVDKAILNAGKHAYSEKPLGVDLADAEEVLRLAEERHLAFGCAPDTFMGGGQQTARKLIDDGCIGKPIAGLAIDMSRGPETWIHAPSFYDVGAGPMLDIGPYFVTCLVNLLGPIESVTAVTGKGAATRVGGPDTVPHVYPVNVDTHQTGVLKFVNGTLVTMVQSFEVHAHTHAPLEIYGSEGSIALPNPNIFGGPVKVFRPDQGNEWREMALSHGYCENSRSVGVADMVMALREKRPHRASGALAYHVLEVMLAVCESSRQGRAVEIKSRCERPAPLPLGLRDGEI